MKNKITYLFFCVSLLLLTGCDHFAADGNLSRYYQPYTGAQKDWPTSAGSFVTVEKGMTIYHSYPPVSYTILGRFDRPNIPMFRVIRMAHYQHANAIWLSEENVTDYETDNGVTFGNAHVAFTTPSTTHAVNRVSATAYLININTNQPAASK
ncbi:MAG TPA: hypothetical protein VIK62_06290 [Verrucomicrobiae bacterium]